MNMIFIKNNVTNDPKEINFKFGPTIIYFCFFLGR